MPVVRDLVRLAVIAIVLVPSLVSVAAVPGTTIVGHVTSERRPVDGAIVRVQAQARFVTTDRDGRFALTITPTADLLWVTAGKVGYYNARARWTSDASPLVIELQPIPDRDNPSYQWQDPTPDVKNADNCGNCHSQLFAEWRGDAHARAAVNPLVRTMYDGTDVRGRAGMGPGYRLDWMDAGDCAKCHAPLAGANGAPAVNLTSIAGVSRTGVSCDFCHKVARVPETPNASAIKVLRPPPGAKLLFGPLDDATFPGDVPDFSPSPIFKRSQFCASCHDGQSWGVPVYETFSEWRASPYARRGVECQSCHMKADPDRTRVALADKGGKLRDPNTIGSHAMMTDDPESFRRSAVALDLAATRERTVVTADVAITNVGAGHHLPTGQPIRNMLLVVSAVSQTGARLVMTNGERLPAWAGDYAGAPGRGFAKILVTLSDYAKPGAVADDDVEGRIDFPAPFWRRNRIQRDTRVAAGETSRSRYVFRADHTAGRVTISARLIYRRAFKPLADVKGWNLPDIALAAQEAVLEPPQSTAR